MIRRRALWAAPVLLAAPALAQPAWPQRPVRLIVPYAAGGGTDILARALAEAMRPHLPHPIVVENRAGAAGVIGSEVVARAEPDGHTLMAVVSTHIMNSHVLSSVPYDPIRDFTPVAMLTRNTMVLAASHTLPFADIPGLVAFSRSHPTRLSSGSTEALSSFIGQELARRIGAEIPDVQYRAGSQLMTDIVAGNLPLGWTSTASATPHMTTGRAKIIAVSTATRTPFFPDVKTVQEQGIPDFDLSGWVAMFGPKGMPDVVTARLNALIERAFNEETFRARLAALGIEPDLRAPAGLLEALQRENRIWAAAAAAGHLPKQ
ncbi:Bug family tripartite tricarboxylate transporter substrate binding protein [Roseococcus sp. YIM B11640]|uniref:Bug family tripartite tricarboxylate transporter substrate binding protein n=1 Tax=Roseococcus sp. YIM B11640 TaxID=3133973 RepID=UPI003C7E3C17